MGIKKAALINAAGKYLKVILSVIINAVLARILSADDYGIVAIITVFSTLFATLSDIGFGAAIVQRKDLTDEDINQVYSLSVYVSVVLAVAFIIISYPIAWFYGNDVFISLGIILSISVFFNALNMVPNGILNREKKFVVIAVRLVVVYLITAIITIFLAKAGLRYYALALESVLTALFTFIWNFIKTRPKFRWKIKKESINKILSYSGFQFAFNIVNYFSRNLDHLLTGKILGSAELGYYSKSYTLMLYPVNNLTGAISPVLHPLLSDYQNQKQIIYERYCKIVRFLACIGIYVTFVCYLGSKEIINILYGSQWAESVVCFQLLSIAIIPQMINSSMGAIFQSIGNTKLLFQNCCINTTITVIGILLGVFVGKSIESLSIFVAVAYVIHFLTASFMLMVKGFKYKIFVFYKQLLPEIIMILLMIPAVYLYPFSISGNILSLIVKGAYLGLIYLALLLITKEYRIFKLLF